MDDEALKSAGGVKKAMTEIYGREKMRRPPSRDELYDCIDILTETIKSHKGRLDALEQHGVKYAGVWQRSLPYRKGLVVTAAGSMWVALRDTREGEQPGKSMDAWQLAEKTRKLVAAGRREA